MIIFIHLQGFDRKIVKDVIFALCLQHRMLFELSDKCCCYSTIALSEFEGRMSTKCREDKLRVLSDKNSLLFYELVIEQFLQMSCCLYEYTVQRSVR